jgi:Holliday junction resolvase
MSDASHDEKLAEVLELHGASGYGVFWLIVEAVAAQMDHTDKCEVKYSSKKWAYITHTDRRTLAKYLQTFSKLALIVSQKCDKFVIVKIPKLLELRDNHTKNLQVTKPATCKQEVEVEVEEEVEKHKYTEEDLRLAKWMFSLIQQLDPKAKKPNFDKWADVVRLMRERDELNHREIAEVFKWANNDSFWKSNILSPSKLRDKFSDLRIKMKSDKPKDKQPMHSESKDDWLAGGFADGTANL